MDASTPRYCTNCGEIFKRPDARCPACGRSWPAALSVRGWQVHALFLSVLGEARGRNLVDEASYGRTREHYEGLLRETRPAGWRCAAGAGVATPAPAAFSRPPAASGPLIFTQPASVPPPPPRPVAPVAPRMPPKPPGPGTLTLVAGWAARRQADFLLYLGAFLVTMAALVFVRYRGGDVNEWMTGGLLAAYTGLFLAAGLVLPRWRRVREAGPIFLGVGAILFPLNFVLAWLRVFDREVSGEWMWLLAHATTAALYAGLARRGFGRLYYATAAVAVVSGWGAVPLVVGLGPEWEGAHYALLAGALQALNLWRLKGRVGAIAIATAFSALGGTLLYSHGAAFSDDV